MMTGATTYVRISRLLPVIFLILTACSSSIPQAIRTAPINNPELKQVIKQPAEHKLQPLRWGGVILEIHNLSNSTRLTILAMPLDNDGEPRTRGTSLGRFIAEFSAFLEPGIYSKNRSITISGRFLKLETHKVGEYPYPHPVVQVEHHHLWPVILPAREYDWPAYWWYDPWYYPYYYPYRPHHLRRP